MPKNEGENTLQTLVKASALLDLLARERDASASELAADLDEPRSSIYRMLSTLQQLGFVDPGTRRGTYRLGLKLLSLGTAVQSRLDVREIALPVMERIHDQTENTIFLCVRRGDDAVCVERLDGRRVTTLALQLGGALPLHLGAGPRALLAHESRESWHEYIAGHDLTQTGDGPPMTAEELIAELERVRREGWSESDQDVTPGIAALGAPIFDSRGAICAALSASGVRDAILGPDAEVRQAIVDGAGEISAALGYRPLSPQSSGGTAG
ncbi:MAG TPA: IclR family transcriptional regulator [Solirubrobacterales bacterium]|nr:IclR family transcriptional regulator [Solirubrobacterales bacterium]